jgi:acyl carrier protein
MAEKEQNELLIGLVRDNAAAVLGDVDREAIAADRSFKELGFDSLTGLELRNRLKEATDVRLRASLITDHPTPAALAARLREAILDGAAA